MPRHLVFGLLAWLSASTLFGQVPKILVLHNVSILALGGEGADIPSQDIIIQGEKITSIRPIGRALPAEALVVDCTNKWALPGLIDAHVRVALGDLPGPEEEQEFVEILASGVTTIFDLGGRLGKLKDLKKQSQAPDWIGPRVFHCGSPLLGERMAKTDSATQCFIVKNAADARAAVRQLKTDGVDAIKIDMNVSAEVTRSAIDEAHASGLLVVGHLVMTSYQEAAKAGIDILDGTSSLVTDYVGSGERKELAQHWFPTYLVAWERVQPEKNARNKIQLLANNAVFFAPGLANELRILQNNVPSRQAALAAVVQEKFTGMLRLAFELQVPLLAGSGYTIHANGRVTLSDELESWVHAGLAPRFAIEAATINASHAMRQSDKLGKLAAGMLADIIVVNDNPTVNIKTLREPWLVIRNGKLYRVEDLKKRLRPHRRNEREIRAVLELQESAWNDYDLDRFMRGYWKNDSTIFASGGEVTRSWNAMLERYKRSYDNAEKMGRLKFDIQQIDFMGGDWAKVLGEWKLLPKEQKHAAPALPMSRGLFTLIFHRVPEGWRIVHDHTSAASVPLPAPEAKPKK